MFAMLFREVNATVGLPADFHMMNKEMQILVGVAKTVVQDGDMINMSMHPKEDSSQNLEMIAKVVKLSQDMAFKMKITGQYLQENLAKGQKMLAIKTGTLQDLKRWHQERMLDSQGMMRKEQAIID